MSHKSRDNPSGCLGDLFAWVETSIGAGSNGKAPATPFTDQTTKEGSNALGFYNVNNGDMPYFTQLARQYAMSDNYHQPVMGGTGANSIMIGAADAYYYTDGNGHAATPPSDQIENPSPLAGNCASSVSCCAGSVVLVVLVCAAGRSSACLRIYQ